MDWTSFAFGILIAEIVAIIIISCQYDRISELESKVMDYWWKLFLMSVLKELEEGKEVLESIQICEEGGVER